MQSEIEVASGTTGFKVAQIYAVRTRFLSLNLCFIFSCFSLFSERLCPDGPWHPRVYTLPAEWCWWKKMCSIVLVQVLKLSISSMAWVCAHPQTSQGSVCPEEICDWASFCCVPTNKARILDQPHKNHVNWEGLKNTGYIIIRRKNWCTAGNRCPWQRTMSSWPVTRIQDTYLILETMEGPGLFLKTWMNLY